MRQLPRPRRRWVGRVLAVATAWLSLTGQSHAASPRRVALVDPDSELEHAVELALSPWAVEVVVRRGEAPGTELPLAGERARALAFGWGVHAVVWISTEAGASLLWIYEADTDSVSARSLTATPPFGSAEAASVALTLKSLLRSADARPPAPPPPPPPSPQSVPPSSFPPAAPAALPPRLTLSAELSLRQLARHTREVHGGLGGVWWLRGSSPKWGIGLEASAGPGVDIDTGRFSGRLRHVSLSSGVWCKLSASRPFTSAFAAAASAHYVELSGFNQEGERGAEVRRVAPSLDLSARVSLALSPRISVGLRVKGLYFPWHVRYLADGVAVLETWPIAAELGASFGVHFP